MKRYLSIICIIFLLFTCIVSPASAADLQSNYINVLDYSFPNGSDSRFVAISSYDNSVGFTLPETSTLFYLDCVAIITGDIPSSVSCSYAGVSTNLSFVHIDGQLYRIYGSLWGVADSRFDLVFNDITQSWITFQSLRIYPTDFNSVDIPLEASGVYSGGEFDLSINFGDSRPSNTIISGINYDDRDYILYLHSPDWRKYDYLEFQVYMNVTTIDSISCVMGSEIVPFDVSYIYSNSFDSQYYISIRIDTTELNRSINDYPMVVVCGALKFDGLSSIGLMNSNGRVIVNDVSPFRYYFNEVISSINGFGDKITGSISSWFNTLNGWLYTNTTMISSYIDTLSNQIYFYFYNNFSNLKTWIQDQTDAIVSAILGDSSEGDEFQNEVDQKNDQLNNMADIMGSVSQPDLGGVDVSADSYIDVNVLAHSMSGVTTIISSPVFLDVVMMALMMATAGYVLFGKR